MKFFTSEKSIGFYKQFGIPLLLAIGGFFAPIINPLNILSIDNIIQNSTKLDAEKLTAFKELLLNIHSSLGYTFSWIFAILSFILGYLAINVFDVSSILNKYNQLNTRHDSLEKTNKKNHDALVNHVNSLTAKNLREFIEILNKDCVLNKCDNGGIFCTPEDRSCVFRDFIQFEIKRFSEAIENLENHDKYKLDSNAKDAHKTVFKSMKKMNINNFLVMHYLDDNQEIIDDNDITFFKTLIEKENIENLSVNWLFVIKNDTQQINEFKSSYNYILEHLSDNEFAKIRFVFKVSTFNEYKKHKKASEDGKTVGKHLGNSPDFGLYGDKFVFISEHGDFLKKKEDVMSFNNFFKDIWNESNLISIEELNK